MAAFFDSLCPRRALALLAALATLPACIVMPANDDNGDDGACTLLGCNDGFLVDFTTPTGAWAPGDYRFDLVVDGKAVTCEAALPLPNCSQGTYVNPCDPPDLLLLESGCALPAEQHGFAGLAWSTTPSRMRVTISRDGVALVDTNLAPTYAVSEPNGPGCGPVCRTASATLAVPLARAEP